MRYSPYLFAPLILLCTMSCRSSYKSFVQQYQTQNSNTKPDYTNLYYWAAHPYKQDPSDSLPRALRAEKKDSLVDVFFLHPTTYTRNKKDWNAGINDALINSKTDYTSILYQASAFNQHARLFAPRYRQVHLSLFYAKDTADYKAFDTAYADVKQAFEYYLQHYYRNQPIVIASHSQGALMAIRLLKDFFDGKPLQQKLVAAYVIGWPVVPSDFVQLKECTSPQQVGCVCSWRTFKKGFVPDYIKKEKEQAWVVNPLSWTTTTEYVSRKENKGSVVRNFNDIIPNTTDAQVQDRVLWSNRPTFPGSFFFRTRNYHIGDINLFWMNVRVNVEERIFAYFNSLQQTPPSAGGSK